MAAVQGATKFVDEPPALLCCICQRIFTDPVISIKCGHTFCRHCIESNVASGQPSCPLDEAECDLNQLVINRAVIGQIEDLQVYCCYGIVSHDNGRSYQQDSEGCSEILKFGQRARHEEACPYSRVVCSMGGERCGLIRRKDVKEHMKTCAQIPCPFVDFGEYMYM